eukprot:GFUD01003671.1.p1 GENE.GFUD01003671.1~~GFUD01003671.1.p1  ORF type:complete len:1771 (+),score=462.40 GFUD01003671.1:44-5356(+)
MLQLRHTVPFVDDVMPNIGLLWDTGMYLDGLILCQNGQVPFSKLILSCHSNLVYQALTDNGEDQVILLKDFSVSVVRGLISLLHGSQVAFTTNKLAETEELLDLLEISLSDGFCQLDQLLKARRSRKRKLNDDEDDVVITFDKKNIKKANISDLIRVGEREVSPKDLELKKRRINYHTKSYTDWSKVAADKVVIKEEPVDEVTPIPIIQRVTYAKNLDFSDIVTVNIDQYDSHKESCIPKEFTDMKFKSHDLQLKGREAPYRLRNRSGSGSLIEESELVVDLSYKRRRRSSGKSDVSKSSDNNISLVKANDDHTNSQINHLENEKLNVQSDKEPENILSGDSFAIDEKVEYVIGSGINLDQEEFIDQDDQEYEPAIVEEQRITTVVIENENENTTSEGLKDVDSSILIHTLSPSKVSRRNRSLSQTTGFLKTEDEAKSLVAPYIAKIDSRPPKYRCLFKDSDPEKADCDYINSRLLMTQCHVYKHLDIYLYQCNYCELKCRLETNFEKHLNTHGVTRRREKMGKYIYLDEKSELSQHSVAESGDEFGNRRFRADFDKVETNIECSSSVEDNDCQRLFSEYETQHGNNKIKSRLLDARENRETIDNIERFVEETNITIDEKEMKLEKNLMETINNLRDTQTLVSPEEGFKKAFDYYFKESESNLFICKICLENKEHFDCERESVIRTHIFKHLNIFIYECKFCGELFRSKQLLKCHNDHIHCKTAEDAFRILDEISTDSDSKNYSQLHSYHTSKKSVFLGEEKARSIISSYIVYNMRREQDEMDVRLECSLCQFRNESEIEVYEHIAVVHLNIYQYKCDFCSLKVKIKRHLIEHMLEKHGLDEQEEKTEMVITQSEDGSVSFVNDPDKNEIKTLDNDNMDDEAAITLNVPVQLSDTFKDTPQDDEFPYAEHNMTVKVGPNGAKKVFVGDAKFPLLRLNRSVLNKLSKGKLLSKKQADEMVFGYTIHNAESKMYECTLCNGTVQKEKSYLIQRHLYDHFNIYFLKCELCNDIFRFATQFRDHLEAHKKAENRNKEESVKKKANHLKDKIGNYHEAEDFSFIPAEEAKDIVESYYTFEETAEEDVLYQCKLCDFTVNSNSRMYNHCLKQHLKIYQYQCDLCDELFKLDIDLKRHYFKIHRKKYQKNVKLDKLAKTDKYYESNETDFPDVDITTISMDQLKGKKISTKQAKSIKGSYMIFNEATKLHECELCDYKREWRGNLQFHVLAEHYDVYLYQCPYPGCEVMLRNWSAFQNHQKSHKEPTPHVALESTSIETDFHLLKEPVYVGEEEGWKIARGYHYYDKNAGLHQCKMCQFSARSQQASIHVLAKHLPCVYLYRCQYCGKDFRYSRVRWREHLALHREGKVKCEHCPDNSDKVFTKESLKAHMRRNHTLGRFTCGVAGCGMVFTTKSEVRAHEKEVHLIGLPAKCVSHVCEWCDYAFPTRSRWKKHVILCQRGTSRTGFRKQISDVLQWLGKGAYKCTFCGVEFHPEPDNVTRTGLPEARNHVATVHGMKHMKKAKMQWHGDPKHYNKEDLYRDKTMFWNQKVKDIEKVRNMAQQESKLFTIQNEVNENIAEAAKSHKAMMEALGYPDKKVLDPNKAVFMKLVQAGQSEDLEPGQLATLQPGDIVEDGLVEHQVVVNIVNENGEIEQRQVVVNIVNENGEIEQRQVILDQSSGTHTLIDQSQLYLNQEEIEPDDTHDVHHEVVFESSEQGDMLDELEVGQQAVVFQSIQRRYKTETLLEQNVEFSDVGSIQIVESVDESNMDYVEVPPQ